MVRVVLNLCYLSNARTISRDRERFHKSVRTGTFIREQVGILIDLLQLIHPVVIGVVLDLRYLSDRFTVR